MDRFDRSKNIESSINLLRQMIDDDDKMACMVFEIDEKCNIVAVNHQTEEYYIIYGERMLDIMAFLNVWDDEALAELYVGGISFRDGNFELGLFTSQYKRKGYIIVNYDENYGRQVIKMGC